MFETDLLTCKGGLDVANIFGIGLLQPALILKILVAGIFPKKMGLFYNFYSLLDDGEIGEFLLLDDLAECLVSNILTLGYYWNPTLL